MGPQLAHFCWANNETSYNMPVILLLVAGGCFSSFLRAWNCQPGGNNNNVPQQCES